MVKVLINKKNELFQKIAISGHAESGPFGNDLVCAGVSAIVGGALNAMDILFNQQTILEVENNKIEITIKDLSNSELQLACKVVFLQLQTIEIQYPKNITLREVT